MRAVDTNILVYAFFADSPFHNAARTVVTELAESAAPWAIPWPCIHEFYAVVTNPRLFANPELPRLAREQIDEWLRSPSLQLLAETAEHWARVKSLIDDGRVAGPAVHDARIAALCLTHGVTELLTQDRDFSEFPQLKVNAVARMAEN